jgi:hypothetical protein
MITGTKLIDVTVEGWTRSNMKWGRFRKMQKKHQNNIPLFRKKDNGGYREIFLNQRVR